MCWTLQTEPVVRVGMCVKKKRMESSTGKPRRQSNFSLRMTQHWYQSGSRTGPSWYRLQLSSRPQRSGNPRCYPGSWSRIESLHQQVPHWKEAEIVQISTFLIQEWRLCNYLLIVEIVVKFFLRKEAIPVQVTCGEEILGCDLWVRGVCDWKCSFNH